MSKKRVRDNGVYTDLIKNIVKQKSGLICQYQKKDKRRKTCLDNSDTASEICESCSIAIDYISVIERIIKHAFQEAVKDVAGDLQTTLDDIYKKHLPHSQPKMLTSGS